MRVRKNVVFVLVAVFLLSLSQHVLADVYDDFNDGVIDLSKWQPWGLDVISESGGVLNFDSRPASETYGGGLRSAVTLGGDFDVSFQYKDWFIDPMTSPPTNSPTHLTLQVRERSGLDDMYYIFRGYFAGSGGYDQYVSNARVDGNFLLSNSVNTSDSSGYLRIKRSGSTIDTYCAGDNKQWNNLFTVPNAYTGPAEFSLIGNLEPNTDDFHVEADNVNVDADSIIGGGDGDGVRDVWGVFIGAAGGSWLDNGATIDAFKTYAIFRSEYDLESDKSKKLIDSPFISSDDLTYSDVSEAIDFLSNADADDLAVFYYSGHGGMQLNNPGRYLKFNNFQLWDWDLQNQLKEVKAGDVATILESCFSSGMEEIVTGINDNSNRVLLAAAGENEKLSSSIVWGSDFTRNLFDILNSGTDSLHEAFDYAEEKTRKPSQHPNFFPHDADVELEHHNSWWMNFFLNSPADLIITDPLGNVISKTENEIGDLAFYYEYDLLGDGVLHDQVLIFDALLGEYRIDVIPQLEIGGPDIFSLDLYLNDHLYNLASNLPIYEGSQYSFTFDSYSAVIPEPSTFLLLGMGLLGIMCRKRICKWG